MSDSAKITAISKQERHNKCYFFDYQPGMLLPAAEKLQQEKSTAVSNIFKSSTPQVVEVFFSYAHEDEELMNDVRRQMIIYERNGTIVKWYDRMIPAGAVWKELIDQRINDAAVIILMFSPSFIESRYCYEVEGQIALRRHTEGSCLVIPVILRPCAWQDSPFGEIQALPTDGKPITQWPDRDQVCLDVAQGIVSTIKARNKS